MMVHKPPQEGYRQGVWQEIPQQQPYQDIETHVPVQGTMEGGVEGHQQPVQEAVGQQQQEIPPQPQLQDTETQGPVKGTATIEKAVKDTKSQCRGLLVSSRMWYRPVRVRRLSNGLRRPRQWVRKGECPM